MIAAQSFQIVFTVLFIMKSFGQVLCNFTKKRGGGDFMLTLRLGAAKDVLPVADMLEEIIGFLSLCEINYPNWHHGLYPTPAVLAAAFARDDLYVAEQDGKIVGTITVNAVQAPQYDGKPWKVEAGGELVRVIHTLAISPAARGLGLAKRLIGYAEDIAINQGATVMRLDTFHKNAPARTLYEGLGYYLVGYVTFTDIRPEGEPYAIYEKLLTNIS